MNPPAHPKDNDFDPDERPGEDNPRDVFDDPSPPSPLGGVRELDDIQLEALAQRVEAEVLRRSPEERGAVAFAEVYAEVDLATRKRCRAARDEVRSLSAGITAFVDRRDRLAKVVQSVEPKVDTARRRVEMTTTIKDGVFAGAYVVWVEVGDDDYYARFGVTLRKGWWRPVELQFTGTNVGEVRSALAQHFSLLER